MGQMISTRPRLIPVAKQTLMALLAAFLTLILAPVPGMALGLSDFAFTSIDGKPMPLYAYKGKTLLVINTASQCGYTPQYAGMQKLWETYRDRGLVVLALPSNDFGGQEPGTSQQIKDFCESTFGTDFPMAEKIVVKGDSAHPFYRWAKTVLGDAGIPKWNFHKILIGPDGRLIAGYPSRVTPQSAEMIAAIESHLP